MDATIKLWNIKYIIFADITPFSLTVLVGISVSWAAFQAPSFFISLKTSSSVTLRKKKTGFRFLPFSFIANIRSSHQRCSVKKLVLNISQYSQENICVGVSFYLKETLIQVFSCEYCVIFKKTYFEKQLRTTTSVIN